ncbi:hypothetical protein CAF53_23725 [Sphingobium sp. LB126]|uniref:energy transducer TonB n=1 Tax=Sphingobium sp. LB126 TaxID=1983755 RepID=UPI000C207789|nr:energy transducer TonB [Sphingobium sp. LB126]PJG45708.1 hypothetical protein CAF53_23725 [Sphingobium sp. LB126]
MKVSEFGQGKSHREAVRQARDTQAGELTGGRYQPSRKLRWISLGIIAAIHVAGFYALQYLDVNIVRRRPVPPLVVNLLPLDPPPPQSMALPTQKIVEQAPKPQLVVVPPPLIAMPAAPTTVQTTTKPEPALPAPVEADEPRPAAPPAAKALANLNTRLLSTESPRYPMESRRRREAGIVVLLVVVDEQGSVSDISIAKSSGFERLDKAALSAVRRWRWSPLMIEGRPSQVTGLVRIPFELKAAR